MTIPKKCAKDVNFNYLHTMRLRTKQDNKIKVSRLRKIDTVSLILFQAGYVNI